jgi:hypothetical protein
MSFGFNVTLCIQNARNLEYERTHTFFGEETPEVSLDSRAGETIRSIRVSPYISQSKSESSPISAPSSPLVASSSSS